MWNTNDLELVKLNFRATLKNIFIQEAMKNLENIFIVFKYLACP